MGRFSSVLLGMYVRDLVYISEYKCMEDFIFITE
jgi:hypothetical protein